MIQCVKRRNSRYFQFSLPQRITESKERLLLNHLLFSQGHDLLEPKVKNPQISENTCLCASAKPNGGVQTFEIGKMAAIDGFINRGLSLVNTSCSMTHNSRGGGGGGWRRGGGLLVCWLLNVPATCECISGTDLPRHFTCCHTEKEVADPTFHLTKSQYTDTGPTSPSTDPITSGAWQGSHWSANF